MRYYSATSRDTERAIRDFLQAPAPADAELILGRAPLILHTRSLGIAKDVVASLIADEVTLKRVRHRLGILAHAIAQGTHGAFEAVIFSGDDQPSPQSAAQYLNDALWQFDTSGYYEWGRWLDAHPELICRSIISVYEHNVDASGSPIDVARAGAVRELQLYCLRRAFAVGVSRAEAELAVVDSKLDDEFAAEPNVLELRSLLRVVEAAGDLFKVGSTYGQRARCIEDHPELLHAEGQDVVVKLRQRLGETAGQRTLEDEAYSLWSTVMLHGAEMGVLRALANEIMWTPSVERSRELCEDFWEMFEGSGLDPQLQAPPDLDPTARDRAHARLDLLQDTRRRRDDDMWRRLDAVLQATSWPELRHVLHQDPRLVTDHALDVADKRQAHCVLPLDVPQLLREIRDLGVDAAVERARRSATQAEAQAQSGRPVVTLGREWLEQHGAGQLADQVGTLHLAMMTHFIGILLRKFEESHEPDLLEDALTLNDTDLDWLQPATAARAKALLVRTAVLKHRLQLFVDTVDLDSIIQCTREAISCPLDAEDRAGAELELAQALLQRFIVVLETRDLTEAVEILDDCDRRWRAADMNAVSARHRTGLLYLLALARHTSYTVSGDEQYLVWAETLLRELLDDAGLSEAKRREALVALALVLSEEWRSQEQRPELLAEALRISAEVASEFESSDVVGHAAVLRAELQMRRASLTGDWSGLVECRGDLEKVVGVANAGPALKLRATELLMEGYAAESNWASAARWGREWTSVYLTLAQHQVVDEYREGFVRGLGFTVGDATLYRALHGEILEAASDMHNCRLLAVEERLAPSAVPKSDASLLRQYERLRLGREREHGDMNPRHLSILQEARRHRDKALLSTRTHALPPNRAEAQRDRLRGAATEAPLLYLSTGRRGGAALVVSRSEPPECVSLPRFTRDAVASLVSDLYDARAHHSVAASLEQVSAVLWDLCMEELIQHLKGARYVLIASGQAGLLPLHAASTCDSSRATGRLFVCDLLELAYGVPSRGTPEKPSAGGLRATVVSDPAGDGSGGLRFSDLELSGALSLHPNARMFTGRAATASGVAEGLKSSHWAHLSCHGEADLLNPRQSHLRLAYGERLRVADLANLGLPDDLVAVLSACESARVDVEVPDEAVGLPGALVAAGARQVVGSNWRVPQVSTAELMVRFYGRLQEGAEAVSALRDAQVATRDSTVESKRRLFSDRGAAYPGLADSDARPASRVYDWAGFALYQRVVV